MYKNQLQELAQRSCFNLPAYACIREGPDHAPRFKATVNFNGEIFESPNFCSTLRQAEHAAAEVALNMLSKKGPSKALAARVLDETGVYKNLLQETAHRAGLKLPVYTTVRSGPGHVPVFSCTVELAGMSFTGETAKTKKQAQKNAAMTAWSALKKLSNSAASPASSSSPSMEYGSNDELEQVIIGRYLASLQPPETNNSSLRYQHHGHNSAPTRRDTSQYGGNRSLFPSQHRNWTHSEISPELPMYQTWLRPHGTHVLPFIHTVFQPDHRQYLLTQEPNPISIAPGICPVLYFPTHPVTIQEIEEKNFLSVASSSSPNTATNSLGCLNSYSKQRHKERLEGKDEGKSGKSMLNAAECSNQVKSNQIETCWISSGQTSGKLRPQAITSKLEANLSYMHGFQSNSRPQNLPVVSSAASVPTRITASTVCSKGLMTSASFIAPAVHIRSVVPVCSAPPAKQTLGLVQERLFAGAEKNRIEAKGEISAQEFGFL